jgi:REP element-mobilizing transposase RayT
VLATHYFFSQSQIGKKIFKFFRSLRRRPFVFKRIDGRPQNFGLDAYVVMPNHVHELWMPHIRLPQLMHRAKGPTDRWANKLLGRVGKPFWQEEHFDRLVRSASECKQIRHYLELNPVKAGLVAHPAEFPWSSAGAGESGSEDPRGLKSALQGAAGSHRPGEIDRGRTTLLVAPVNVNAI